VRVNEAEFQELVGGLPPRDAAVYRELLERGLLVAKRAFDSTPDAGPHLSRLAAAGLVRRTGRKQGRQALWEPVREAGDVEAAAEAFQSRHAASHGKRWRPSSDPSHPVGLRVAEFKRLAEDPEVQAAIVDPEGSTRRQRSRLKEQLRRNEQARRRHATEFREAQERAEAHAEFIQLRNRLAEGVDRCRAINALIEDELERIVHTGEPRFATDVWWPQLVPLLADGVAKYEQAYALVARLVDAPPLPERTAVIEGELIEDAELILELTRSTEEAASQP
jgi:hypothetical protein